MPAVFDIKSGPHEAYIELQVAAYNELQRNGTEEGLEFMSEDHTFYGNGELLPSVTKILREMGLTPDGYNFIDPWYLRRGTFVHLVCEYFDKGTLCDDYDDESIIPYLEAYKTFRRDYSGKITGIEKKLWHPKLKYAGIIDRVIEGNTCYALHLKPGNKVPYKLEEVTQIRSHFNVFLSALIVSTDDFTNPQYETALANITKWKLQNLKGDPQ